MLRVMAQARCVAVREMRDALREVQHVTSAKRLMTILIRYDDGARRDDDSGECARSRRALCVERMIYEKMMVEQNGAREWRIRARYYYAMPPLRAAAAERQPRPRLYAGARRHMLLLRYFPLLIYDTRYTR